MVAALASVLDFQSQSFASLECRPSWKIENGNKQFERMLSSRHDVKRRAASAKNLFWRTSFEIRCKPTVVTENREHLPVSFTWILHKYGKYLHVNNVLNTTSIQNKILGSKVFSPALPKRLLFLVLKFNTLLLFYSDISRETFEICREFSKACSFTLSRDPWWNNFDGVIMSEPSNATAVVISF